MNEYQTPPWDTEQLEEPEPPHDATHWHRTCATAVQSFLKFEKEQWFTWYDVGDGEWLPVSYPEWVETIPLNAL